MTITDTLLSELEEKAKAATMTSDSAKLSFSGKCHSCGNYQAALWSVTEIEKVLDRLHERLGRRGE